MAEYHGGRVSAAEHTQMIEGPLRLIHLENLMFSISRGGFASDALVDLSFNETPAGPNSFTAKIREDETNG